jgi:hypothetical protein
MKQKCFEKLSLGLDSKNDVSTGVFYTDITQICFKMGLLMYFVLHLRLFLGIFSFKKSPFDLELLVESFTRG